MNPWPFVIAAYALVGIATALTAWTSFRAMRRDERAADEARGR